MPVPPESLPEVVRNRARAVGAEDWVAGLPELVAQLESDWQMRVGRAYSGGTEAFVADVELADGAPAVLKLLIPRPGEHARNEIAVLELTRGEGCVALLRHDVGRSALLLERLGPSMYDLKLPIDERHLGLCAAVARVWRPAPGAPFQSGADKGRWLVDYITETWESLGRPCDERCVEHALACAQRRIAAHDDERALLVHGDVHQWNALRAGDGFKLVDPDGLLAEPEYDLGILMREDPVELLEGDPRDRSRRLAALTGRDETAIWEWGVVERVSTGLMATVIDLQPEGRHMLAAAERIARLG